jgi:hypothetical protein
VQAILQGRWPEEPSALCLPHFTVAAAAKLAENGFSQLADFVAAGHGQQRMLTDELHRALDSNEAEACLSVIDRLPLIEMSAAPLDAAARGGGGLGGGMVELSVMLRRVQKVQAGGKKGAGHGGQRARVFAPRCGALLLPSFPCCFVGLVYRSIAEHCTTRVGI